MRGSRPLNAFTQDLGASSLLGPPEGPGPQHLEVSPALSAAGFVDVRTVNVEVHIPVVDPQTCRDFEM